MNVKSIFITGLILSAFALIGNFSVMIMEKMTHEQIEINKKQALLNDLYQLVDKNQFNNDIIKDKVVISDDLLSEKQAVDVYRAYKDNKPVAAIIQAIAPDGYSGSIFLLVGVNLDGTLGGVRVTEHKETPGLGDEIDQKKSDWVDGFKQKSLSNPKPKGWKVKKDGGVFDQFSGATISPRAVVKAVYKALQFYKNNQKTLFNKPEVKQQINE